MARYIPMPAYPDMMPVDISFVFEDEKPAGKHGFTQVRGEDLYFEDGTLARFWGVNFNGGACFPSHDYAEKVARRLAQSGCNIVRFHQLDAEWDTPNIYGFTKGKRVKTTRELDPKSMDALDYLIHCLKEEGIYCYMDMMTYRKFKEGDDVESPELLTDSAKPWSIVNARLIELQKEFCDQFWNHYNPYTKLQHKDDPVFVMTEITNECDLFFDSYTKRWYYEPEHYYMNEYRQLFKAWLEENNLEYDWENCPLYSTEEIPNQFKVYLTKKYYQEMYDHMRAIGVKIPITGTNWTRNQGGLAMCHEDMDFSDSHHYYYDWRWGNNDRMCAHRSITSSSIAFPNLAKMALANKPFFVSEWDMPWPNSYRAEGPIYYAAVGALQNWTGFAIHTYAYGTRMDKMDILGRELSTPVAGVPYREGIFSVWNDPAKFGLFYHAALITRRADVSPANKKVAVNYDKYGTGSTLPFNSLLERHQAKCVFDGKIPEGYEEIVNHDQAYCPTLDEKGMIVSDNGQLWRDVRRKIGAVDTPRTKVLYGSIGTGSRSSVDIPRVFSLSLNGMEITCATDFGVIAVSSLTDDPIEKSDNILLSAIGRAHNSGQVYDGEKMIDIGHAPIMAEVITSKVSIRTELGDKLKVWGVNAEGFYAGQLPTTYENGVLSFEIGDENNPACYYLIVKE